MHIWPHFFNFHNYIKKQNLVWSLGETESIRSAMHVHSVTGSLNTHAITFIVSSGCPANSRHAPATPPATKFFSEETRRLLARSASSPSPSPAISLFFCCSSKRRSETSEFAQTNTDHQKTFKQSIIQSWGFMHLIDIISRVSPPWTRTMNNTCCASSAFCLSVY